MEANRADLARKCLRLCFRELVGLHLKQPQLELLEVARDPLGDRADEFTHALQIPQR